MTEVQGGQCNNIGPALLKFCFPCTTILQLGQCCGEVQPTDTSTALREAGKDYHTEVTYEVS